MKRGCWWTGVAIKGQEVFLRRVLQRGLEPFGAACHGKMRPTAEMPPKTSSWRKSAKLGSALAFDLAFLDALPWRRATCHGFCKSCPYAVLVGAGLLVQGFWLLSIEVWVVGGLYLQSSRRIPTIGHSFAEHGACLALLEECETAPITIGLRASGS